MRKVASTVFFAAFAGILIGVAAALITLATGTQAAMWIGGWGVLFLAPAALSLALLCLIFGIALRASYPGLSTEPLVPANLSSRVLGYVLIAAGLAVLGYHAISYVGFLTVAGHQLGLYALIPFFGLELPIGLAALLYGIGALSQTRGAGHGDVLGKASLPQAK